MSIVVSDGFYMPAVEWICQINRNRLQVWLSKGWIKATKSPATGSGTKNIFNENDLMMITIFKKAVENGLSRTAVKNLMPAISTNLKSLITVKDGNIELNDQGEGSVYLFFFRREGEVLESCFADAKNIIGKQFRENVTDADDVIGFNLSKIKDILNARISEYFRD